jgi:hypothetical protein
MAVMACGSHLLISRAGQRWVSNMFSKGKPAVLITIDEENLYCTLQSSWGFHNGYSHCVRKTGFVILVQFYR